MPTETDAYLDAIDRLACATKEAERISGVFKQLLESLHSWQSLEISSTDDLPSVTAVHGRRRFDANSWPTIEELHRVLFEYHKAKAEVRKSWDAVPDDRKKHLPKP